MPVTGRATFFALAVAGITIYGVWRLFLGFEILSKGLHKLKGAIVSYEQVGTKTIRFAPVVRFFHPIKEKEVTHRVGKLSKDIPTVNTEMDIYVYFQQDETKYVYASKYFNTILLPLILIGVGVLGFLFIYLISLI